MDISVDYLLRNYRVDDMLWWFRWRQQGMHGRVALVGLKGNPSHPL